MGSVIGNTLKISLFGESHGPVIGLIIDGLPAGIKLDYEFIDSRLNLRKSDGVFGTLRTEKDNYEIVSGVFNDFTTGAPICVLFKNESIRSSDYEKIKDIPRPGHADYAAFLKYNGYSDYRGGGHFSGRLTAPIVFAGAIATQLLNLNDVMIATHICRVKNIRDADFQGNLPDCIEKLNTALFPVIDSKIEAEIKNEILNAKKNKDSVGGVLETAIINIPFGIGEPFFNSIESIISSYLFSIPGVKGVEFGLGFDFAKLNGSEVSDSLSIHGDLVKIANNFNGGINGGISNGEAILVKTAFKPTSSIGSVQKSISLSKKENVEIEIDGRHDPAIFLRARVVVDSLIALAILDLIYYRHGNLWGIK